MSDHILLAYTFDGKGGGQLLADDVISQQVRSDKVTAWVHLDANHPDTREWLMNEVSYLDSLVLDALLAEETRPRMQQIGEGALLILRGVNLNENSDPEDMVSIRIWVDKYRIISLRKRKLKAVRDVEGMLQANKGPKNSGEFACMIISRLLERMEPTLNGLDDDMDDIEEKVLEDADSSLRDDIVEIRKKAIIFHRYMSPQRDAIAQLSVSDFKWLSAINRRQLQESHNHVTRFVEDLEAVRERSQVTKDELTNMMAEKLNSNMYVLSAIAAIFLPLGFLTGLLGINVAGIPGAENPNAFYVFCAMLIGIVFFQVVLFKKMKWF